MTKKIFRSILLVASAVLLCCLTLVMGVLYEYFTTVQRSQLSAQMALAAKGVETDGMAYLEGLSAKDGRITWIAADGTVLFDTQADPATMENHLNRAEVAGALTNGAGESFRDSATLAQRTFYHAKKLSDGTVLRISVTQYSVLSLALGMLQPVLILLVVAIVLSAVLASRLAKRIVKPLNELDLDKPLDNDAYEELAPLLGRVERQHEQIDDQLDELKRRQDEFSAVTDSMNEGLILLNEKGFVLSINPAAQRVFGVDASCVGKDFLTVDRSRDVARVIETAMAEGRGETSIERAGREYQLDASRTGLSGQRFGAALLVFDVTDRVFAERNRREFTANVSHELKTPLQSIMGSAELIENGLVKQEDMPRFVGHIRTEAARLVTLIDDIIRLSQLDEGGELPRERIDLTALARETAATLADAAAAKSVTVTVTGESAMVVGVRRLLQEIVFNLCDNAIKYNRAGGSVSISVAQGAQGATLRVSDTGIGIPPEHQSRVFERFYRVDKSHSKETGGTGLGLSIVKHAAQYLGASIELESRPEAGTTVTVAFPKS